MKPLRQIAAWMMIVATTMNVSVLNVIAMRGGGEEERGWESVRQLPVGVQIQIAVTRSASKAGSFLGADDVSIRLLNTSDALLPGGAKRALTALVGPHVDVFASVMSGQSVRGDEIEVTYDGIFYLGRRCADFPEVFQEIAREDVLEVSRFTSVTRRYAIVGGAAGAAIMAVQHGGGFILIASAVMAFWGAIIGHNSPRVQVIYRPRQTTSAASLGASPLPIA